MDKTADDAAVFGIDPSALSPAASDSTGSQPDSGAAYEVWDENWDTVVMFLRMQTQWSTTMAGYLGLKYEVLLMSGGLFDLYCVEDRLGMLEGLQIMETAALSCLGKEEDK